MARWNYQMTASSAINTKIELILENSPGEGAYEVVSFTAPKKAVYRFDLKGSGGTNYTASGGSGGSTIGYMMLEKGQTIYAGCGGTCSAAFIAAQSGSSLASIHSSYVYFVAGAGGAGSQINTNADYTSNGPGGTGGGTTGGDAADGGKGGTQTSGGANYGRYYEDDIPKSMGTAGSYGTGGTRGEDTGTYGGRGGDGYYGGGGGYAKWGTNSTSNTTSSYGYGGGGGSGYVYKSTLIINEGSALQQTYSSTTSVGGGASANNVGSVAITYISDVELPVTFNGTKLLKLYFNDQEVKGLYFNGILVY